MLKYWSRFFSYVVLALFVMSNVYCSTCPRISEKGHQILKNNLEVNPIDQWTIQWNGLYPQGIAVDSNNYIYISTIGKLVKLSPEGKVVKTWASIGGKILNRLGGIVINAKDDIYLVDYAYKGNSRIIKMDSEGTCLMQFPIKCSDNPHLHSPSIAVDTHGCIYIASNPSAIICKYSPSGKLLLKWNIATGMKRANLVGIVLDTKGHIYVADLWASYLRQYNVDGSFVKNIPLPVKDSSGASLPAGICIDHHDNIYVTDMGLFAVTKFKTDGILQKTWSIDEIPRLGSIAIDTSASLYVTDSRQDMWEFSVIELNAKGTEMQRWRINLENKHE